MARNTRKTRRRTAADSAQQRAEAREAAAVRLAELSYQGETAVAAPGAGRRTAAAIRSVSVARFSLRNQVLLIEQAQERGIELGAVGTYRQWQALGRQVRRGEKGLTVIAPAGQARDGVAAEADTEATTNETTAGEATTYTGRQLYRLLTVFDASQTDAAEDTDAPDLPEEDPTAVRDALVSSLISQAERAGYTVEHLPAIGDAYGASTDHDARALYLTLAPDADTPPTPATVAEIAESVAEIVARADAERRATREQPDADAEVVLSA